MTLKGQGSKVRTYKSRLSVEVFHSMSSTRKWEAKQFLWTSLGLRSLIKSRVWNPHCGCLIARKEDAQIKAKKKTAISVCRFAHPETALSRRLLFVRSAALYFRCSYNRFCSRFYSLHHYPDSNRLQFELARSTCRVNAINRNQLSNYQCGPAVYHRPGRSAAESGA